MFLGVSGLSCHVTFLNNIKGCACTVTRCRHNITSSFFECVRDVCSITFWSWPGQEVSRWRPLLTTQTRSPVFDLHIWAEPRLKCCDSSLLAVGSWYLQNGKTLKAWSCSGETRSASTTRHGELGICSVRIPLFSTSLFYATGETRNCFKFNPCDTLCFICGSMPGAGASTVCLFRKRRPQVRLAGSQQAE